MCSSGNQANQGKLQTGNRTATPFCLPKGRLSEAAHEIQGCSSQKCSRGGVGWGVSHRGGWGYVMQGWVGQAFNRKPLKPLKKVLMVKPLKPLFFSEKTFI